MRVMIVGAWCHRSNQINLVRQGHVMDSGNALRMYTPVSAVVGVVTYRELKWHVGCHYSRDRKRCTLTISRQRSAEALVLSCWISMRMNRLETVHFVDSLVV